MKTGVILYVIGGEGPHDDFDMRETVKNLGIKADRVETVFGTSPHFDVMDAWWLLTAKGMKKIVFMLAEFTQNAEFRLMGREFRLCG